MKLKRICYILLCRRIEGITGSLYSKFVWDGELSELLWLDASLLNVTLVILAWGTVIVCCTIRLGLVGVFLGIFAVCPVVIAWDWIVRKISGLAMEYYNETEN